MKNMTLVESGNPIKVDILVVPLCTEDSFPETLKVLDRDLKGGVKFNVEQESFKGEWLHHLLITTNGAASVTKILIIGLGPRAQLTPHLLQEAGGRLASLLQELSSTQIAVDTTLLVKENGAAHLAFGMSLKSWCFEKYCSKKKCSTKSIQFITHSPKEVKAIFDHFSSLSQAILNAREVISEPANVLYPEAFAERCLVLKKAGLQVEVLDAQQLSEIGMHALLAVGQGSAHSPRVVVLQWKGTSQDTPPIALVGKGVCYDSGGINIKTTHLVEMKWDKAGAGAVMGTLHALALMKAPVNVIGILGLVENMPDGASFKPGDILKTFSGKTVEVLDTDNEGRLVLADCLWYIQERFSPEVVIDIATLTLETMGALAGEYGGLFCEEETLSNELLEAGKRSGEKLWSLPMGDYFARQIQSSVADIKNMGILGYGESGATAEFLKCFIQSNKKWAHLDIAGVAWTQEELPLCSQGVTAFGIRLLISWLMREQSR